MSTQRLVLGVAALAIGAGIAWSCLPRRGGGETLTIGAVLAQPPSSLGQVSEAVRQGLLLAKSDIDAEWNGSPKLELAFVDAGGSSSGAVERLRELKSRGVVFVAEVVGSDAILGAAGTVRAEKLLVMTSVSSDPSVVTALGSNGFSAAPGDAGVVRELFQWTRELGASKPALVVDESPRAEEAKNSFLQSGRGLGLDRVFPVARGQVGAQKIAERIQQCGADAVILMSAVDDSTDLLASLPAKLPIVAASDALDLERLKKRVAPEVLPRVHVLSRPDATPAPRHAAVEAAWRKQFGANGANPAPEVFAAYDGLQALARATRGSGTDVERVSAKLRMLDYDGATGRVAFDENGCRRPPPLTRRVLTDQAVSVPFVSQPSSLPVVSK